MNEAELLRQELDHYRSEKERIRGIIGQIGGTNAKTRDTFINILFLIIVCGLFVLDLISEFAIPIHWLPPNLSMELALLLVSLKIIWMIHKQTKVDHFQFWMLNSIEYQVNAVSKRIQELDDKLTGAEEVSRSNELRSR